jgi:hypothetical protein
MVGHQPHNFPLMQKYQSTARNLFCNFFKSVGHEKKNCCAFDLMRERIADAYKVHGEESEGGVPEYNNPIGYNQVGRGGFIGCKR